MSKKKKKKKAVETENLESSSVQETASTSPPLFMRQNLVGRGWKFCRRRASWLDGLMICMRKALRRLVFVIVFSSTLFIFAVDLPPGFRYPRWRLHRKEPGWAVGEHRHVLEGDEFLVAISACNSPMVEMACPSYF